ncbi:MAG: hypothetical protein IJ365_06440 [Clostridia bacterium]|nr:hypothetical protein [Clostridia bacterium]
MDYCEEPYTGTQLPRFEGAVIPNAVPGYRVDMTEAFTITPFYCRLRGNPGFSYIKKQQPF